MRDTFIEQLGSHVGEEVRVRGWLYNKRSSGKIRFLLLRDGTGIVQAVMAPGELPQETFDLFDVLTQESSLVVTGVVRADPRSPGGHELQLTGLEAIQVSADYPITPKAHGTPFLLDHRHLWLRSRRPFQILRIRDEVIRAIREFFHARGFLLIDTPILTAAIGETAQTLFATQYFEEGTAYLAQTGQLYLEAAAAAFGRVYCFGPTFRAEKSKTRRHLTEFWMVEAEVAFATSDDNMRLQEEMVASAVQRVLERRSAELKALERDTSRLAKVVPPFPRLTYDEALETLARKGHPLPWGSDLGGDEETLLSEEYGKPLFVMNYPRRCKAFYMAPHPERPDVVLCDDLLAPEGYGEIIGGSQRIDDLALLQARIREEGLPEEAYNWYCDLRRYGTFPHSGFGLGLERTVAWICGLSHLREAIPFPRLMNRLRP